MGQMKTRVIPLKFLSALKFFNNDNKRMPVRGCWRRYILSNWYPQQRITNTKPQNAIRSRTIRTTEHPISKINPEGYSNIHTKNTKICRGNGRVKKRKEFNFIHP